MKQITALQDGFRAVEEHIEKIRLAGNSKARYQKAISDISEFFVVNDASEYSAEMTEAYRGEVKSRVEKELISPHSASLYSRLSFMLDSYYAGQPIENKYSRGTRYRFQLNDFYRGYVNGFEIYMEKQVTPISIPGYISIAREFFFFLQDREKTDLFALTDEDIVQFMVFAHESHPGSMNNVCCTLRKIASFLAEKGSIGLSSIPSYKAAPTRRVIYAGLQREELGVILSTPDRNTGIGKRDYAVLLLASFTGLRAIDIANLRFENYHPSQRMIYLVQHKTGTPIGLPIPEEVVESIEDYVNNGRPDATSDFIFLTHDRPFRKLSDVSSVRNILLKQLKNSHLGYTAKTGRGFHVFRRTMGKWLLGASVNPEMISQVLGHRDGEVLKRYLPLAPDSLRDCSLDFEFAPLSTEVLK